MVGYKYPRADSNCRENLLCFAFFLDCKTVGFFLKISKEIGKAWRKSLVRDLLFDCSRVLEYAKIGTVLQSTFFQQSLPNNEEEMVEDVCKG